MKKPLKYFLWMAIFCLVSFTAFAQTKKITGVISDETGESITGASVSIIGSNRGTVSDMDGKFTVETPESAILKISYLGYVTQNVKVGKTQTELKIILKEDVQILNEVVVTAMGITREAKSLSYAREAVDAESMRESRGTNFMDMLSGKVAGMQVTPGGGPLASTRIVIRGNNSITQDNQPLFVIDGVPIDKLSQSGESGDLDFGSIANSINPDEVENIEILKGANASALYGSDGANGVVLITTKKASLKKGLGISYGLNSMFSYLYSFPTYQNIYGQGTNGMFRKGWNTANNIEYNPELPYGIHVYNLDNTTQSWGMPMLGFDVVGRDNVVRPYSPSPGTIRDMYQMGMTTTHSLSVDKVTNDLTMRFSYTNIRGDDILENFNKINRNVFNLRSTAKLAKFLDLDMGVRYTNETVDNRGFRNNNNRNPLRAIMGMSRDATKDELIPWKQPDGTPNSRMGAIINPYWLLYETSNADENQWITANASLYFKLSKLFQLRLKGATDVNAAKNWNFSNYNSPFDVYGQYERGSNLNKNHNFDVLFSYNQRLSNNITLTGNMGASAQMIRRYTHRSVVAQLNEPDMKSLANNGGTMASSETYNGKNKQAVFGMGGFGYKDWLYVDATARNEYSSALPERNNSYFYYSFGTSLILSDLLKINKKILSFAKLRASYAEVGNDTGFDQLYAGYNYAGMYQGNAIFSGESDRKNPQIKPERTISKEIGADVRFWDNRVSIDMTYYDKSTHDQIIRADVSPVGGYGTQVINAGEIRNWGTEIVFNITPVKTKNFTWTSTLNWAKNDSEVVSLPEGISRFILGTAPSGNLTLYAAVGKPYGAFYGNDIRRDAEGHPLVNITGVLMYDPDRYLGTVQPDWIGGWRNTFRIGPVDVNVMLDLQHGGQVWSFTAYEGARSATTVQTLEGRYEYLFSDLVLGETADERAGFMTPGNTVQSGTDQYQVFYPDNRQKGIYVPGAYYDPTVQYWAGQPSHAWIRPMDYFNSNGGYQASAKRYIFDASYVKLREIGAGWFVPKKWLAKTPLTDVKLSVVGRNVAILFQNTPKGMDPQATRTTGNAQGFEEGFALPQAYWGFDFKVSF